MVGALTPRQHLLEERRELLGGVAGGVGRRAADGRAQRIRRSHAQGSAVVEPFEVLHEPVDERVAQPAHLVGWQRERFWHRPPCNSSLVHRYAPPTGFRREGDLPAWQG